MFSNAKQQIPERFREKMAIDKEIEENQRKINEMIGTSVLTFHNLHDLQQALIPLREERDVLKRRQQEKSAECMAFIADQKARGPNA